MFKADLAVTHGILHDGIMEKPVVDSVLLVSGGKIFYAGPYTEAPDYLASEEIQAKGLCLLPGLIDLHVHAIGEEKFLKSFLFNGVTTVRDLASDPYTALERKAKERSGRIPSPRLFASGPVLTCPGGYPENVWGSAVAFTLKGRYQAEDRVKKLSGLGMDVIKIGLEHELGPCLSKSEMEGLVEAAHYLGKRVTAHATNETDFEFCVAHGVDEIAHMPARPVSDDLWKEAVRKKIIILPTLHAHAGWAEEWKRRLDHPFGQFCRHGFSEGHRQSIDNLVRFLSFGGKVAYGTDAGNPHMPFGVSILEWKDLQSAGISPAQCLKMATSDAAKVLGDDTIGSLEKGKWADFGLYLYDPLTNPEHFRTLQMVYKGGKAYRKGRMEFPKSFDLNYWINQWEKTKFRKGWSD
jgi:imidazolonepropionase-like amidohydrolase